MIKKQRHKRILSILSAEGAVEIAELARVMPEVSRVTLRRDITELAETGSLRRTHGGAVLPDAIVLRHPAAKSSSIAQDNFAVDDLDAVILPPISGRGGDALRRQIGRRGIPFLAESAPQVGGVYIGPNNLLAGQELGQKAGEDAGDKTSLNVLVVGQPELSNTKERASGFEAGLVGAFDGTISFVRVNGQGSYRTALRVVTDAIVSAESFDLIFAVNDHSAIAATEALSKVDYTARIYATGGEAPEFVAHVADEGPITAIAAFFPELAGVEAVDLVARQLAGTSDNGASYTLHRIVTADTLNTYYESHGDRWTVSQSFLDAQISPLVSSGKDLRGNRIGFMPHYPAHDWYRAMIIAMQGRAAEYGFDLVISPPHHSIAAEIARLRSEIACTAAENLVAHETILINEGEATLSLAAEIRRIAFDNPERLEGLTVITNALDVLHRLDGTPGIKTILTGGEYQAADRCLVGPSLGAIFERLRADRAFLSVAGLSNRFGVSSMDERLALVGSRFVNAATKTVILADHTQIGTDANHRVARIDDIHQVITDDGAVPADRQSLRAAGVDVIVAAQDGGNMENPSFDNFRQFAGPT